MTPRTIVGVLAMTIAASLLASPLRAEEAAAPASEHEASHEQSSEELAKQTQNPIADLISVPFNNFWFFHTGPEKRTVWNLNVEPVIPIHLTHDWNLITRTIVPIFNVPSLAPGVDHVFGMGDINPTFFLSPVGKEFLWGVGPTFTLPTATDRELGNGKYSAGPAAVGVLMKGPWVAGALANNQWSFAGWGDTKVNAFLLQPFVNYNLSHGWFLGTAPIMTANWVADSGDRWLVPLGGGGGRLIRLRQLPGGDRLGDLGKLPVNTILQAYYDAVRPDDAPTWQLRLQFTFLFPE